MTPPDQGGPTRYNWQRWALAIFAVIGAITAITLTITDENDPKTGTHRKTISIRVDGADKDTKADDKLTIGPAAVQLVEQAEKAPDKFDLGGDLRGPDPTQAGVVTGPLASQEWPGCKTAFVKSFSARTRPIKAIAVHYTAGGNLPGWSDIDGLTVYSSRYANQVSWHFSIDREGHCAYNVPLNQKAWTISGLNSETVNIEVAGRGTEPDYGGKAGMRRLALVVQRIARIHHIPIRLGATDGKCKVTRSGILTHWMGGPCSGGHIDIRPYSIEKVIAAIRAYGVKPITATDRTTCRKLVWWREHGRSHGLPEKRAVRRRAALDARHVRCTSKGPVPA